MLVHIILKVIYLNTAITQSVAPLLRELLLLCICVGFMWQGFGTGGLQGWAGHSRCPMSDQSQLQMAPKGTWHWAELSHEWHWLCLCESRSKKGNNRCSTAAGRGVRNMRETALRATRCRRAGVAPGAEQKFPAAQERPTERQAALLQPAGTMWRSPRVAMEQPWRRCSTWRAPAGAGPATELQPVERSLQWGRNSGRAAAHGDPFWSSY